MEVAGCEISRLPEELLAAVLSLTTPLDACRSAAASVALRAAADSDAVWARFLPRDLPPLADGKLSPPPAPQKELFLRLSEGPVLFADGLMSMCLERKTGATCYMLSARALVIPWGDSPQYWRWIPLPDSRFSEGAQLLAVCWLEIRGKIQSSILSRNYTYAAYFVFKLSDRFFGLAYPPQETSVSIGGIESKHQISLEASDSKDVDDDDQMPRRFWFLRGIGRRPRLAYKPGDGVLIPVARSDGWMEVEMGEFYNEEGDDREILISLTETSGGQWKRGLIVQGIEIRPK